MRASWLGARSRMLLVAIAALLSACRGGDSKAVSVAGTYDVPRAPGPIALDGECIEPSWPSAFRSPPFQDSRGRAAPFTELRATADESNLYLCVYVGDLDIESAGDKVQLDVGQLRIVVTPKGGQGHSGVRIAVATDDTIDQPKDYDEEWLAEIAIPWSLLPTREVPVRALRVDVGNGGPPHALAWPPFAPALLRYGHGGSIDVTRHQP